MTNATAEHAQTARLPLVEAAIGAAQLMLVRERQSAIRYAEQSRQASVETATEFAVRILGEHAKGATWTPLPDRAGGYYDRYNAEATIDGLRLRFAGDASYDGHLYLQRRCPNHDPAEDEHTPQQAAFDSLEGLGELLGPVEANRPDPWHCETCSRIEYEQAEDGEKYIPKSPSATVEQRLTGALAAFISARISDYHDPI